MRTSLKHRSQKKKSSTPPGHQGLFWLLLTIAIAHLLTMPAVECPGDAVAVRVQTVGLLNTGQWKVPAEIATTFGDKGQYFFYNKKNKGWQPKYGIGNTLVYIPALFLEKMITGSLPLSSPNRVFYLNLLNIGFTLGTATYLYLLVGRYTASGFSRSVFILSALYCTFWWNHTRVQAFEAFQPFFLCAAVYHLIQGLLPSGADPNRQGHKHLVLSAAFLGFLLLLKTLYVILLPIFFCAVFLKAYRTIRTPDAHLSSAGVPIARYSAFFAVPALAAFGLLLTTNYLKFGSPFATGYAQWTREAHPMSGNILEGLAGYLFSPQYSMFLTFPVLPLAFWKYPYFFRRFRSDALLLAAIGTVLLFTNAKFMNWAGHWCYGPRYLLPALSLMSVPFVFVLDALSQNLAKAWAKAASLLILAVLLASCYLQLQINAVHFFAFYHVKEGLVDHLKDPDLDAFFSKVPYPWVCRDLREIQEGKPVSWYRQLMQRIAPNQTAGLNAYFRQISSSNYYLFPDQPAELRR